MNFVFRGSKGTTSKLNNRFLLCTLSFPSDIINVTLLFVIDLDSVRLILHTSPD